MPVKKATKVKKPRAPRAPSETNKKKSQKLKQVQKVNVNVTSSGGSGGGGTSAPLPFIPQQFRDTSGENVRLENILSSISRRLNASEVKAIPEQPVPRVTIRDQGIPVQFAQSEPDIPTTPIPTQSVPNMPDAVMNPAGSVETIFNAPIKNNMSLPEVVADFERGYEELFPGATETITPVKRKKAPVSAYEDLYAGQRGFKTPPPETPPPEYLSMGAGYVGTPAEPFITRNGRWRADVSRADLERLAQDYNIPTSGVDESGKAFKLNKEQIKSILNVRLGL